MKFNNRSIIMVLLCMVPMVINPYIQWFRYESDVANSPAIDIRIIAGGSESYHLGLMVGSSVGIVLPGLLCISHIEARIAGKGGYLQFKGLGSFINRCGYNNFIIRRRQDGNYALYKTDKYNKSGKSVAEVLNLQN